MIQDEIYKQRGWHYLEGNGRDTQDRGSPALGSRAAPMRQIAEKMRMGRRTITRIVREEKIVKPPSPSILQSYEGLIAEWYKDYPFLRATQVYRKLKAYGYKGCYGTVKRGTQRFRQKRPVAFHELEFLPGEDYGKKEIMLS